MKPIDPDSRDWPEMSMDWMLRFNETERTKNRMTDHWLNEAQNHGRADIL